MNPTNNEQLNQSKGICLIYLRVSTGKQAEKGIAIPTQKDECFKCAREENYTFNEETDVYRDEGESARSMDRPALLEMLNRCEIDKTIKSIIIYDVSRLARDRIDFALIKRDLKKYGIKLISATEGIDDSPEGQMLEGMLSTVAEFFSTQNSRKVKANMLKKAQDGGYPGRASYGYINKQERASTGKVKSWIEVHWEHAKWVQRAFELFATGHYSEEMLMQKLRGENFPLRPWRGKVCQLNKSTLANILRDKFYIGFVEWDDRVITEKGNHELFLDRGVFDRVQAILDARLGTNHSRMRRLFSPLKGIGFCEECGSRMVIEERQSSNGTIHRYFRCMKAKHSQRVVCGQKYGEESEYLKQMLAILKLIKLPDATVIKLKERMKDLLGNQESVHQKARLDINGKLEDITVKKKNLLLDKVGKAKLTISDLELYDQVSQELEANEQRLRGDLGKIENKLSYVFKTIKIALELTVSIAWAFEKAKTPELQALIAKTIFKTVYFRDKKIVRVKLNEPLDYLCKNKLRKHAVFDLSDLEVSGGRAGLEPWILRYKRGALTS